MSVFSKVTSFLKTGNNGEKRVIVTEGRLAAFGVAATLITLVLLARSATPEDRKAGHQNAPAAKSAAPK